MAGFEHFSEIRGDWRAHFGASAVRVKDTAVAALRRAQEKFAPADADAAAELAELLHRLAPAS